MRLTSLAPVVMPDCRVLILGSMPGQLSLERGEYYAHPRNRFWQVMGELSGARPELDYEARLARLQAAGVGLWDVLRHCVRAGSLDTSIVRESEVSNDFQSLLGALPSLRAVALNGAKAALTFRRTVVPGLAQELVERVTLVEMPSTSPANASKSLRDLLQAWSRLVPYLTATRAGRVDPVKLLRSE